MSPNRKKQSWRALHTQAYKNNLLATNIQSQLKLIEPRGTFHPGVKKLIKDRRPRYNDLWLTCSKVNSRPRPVIGWLEPLFASLSLIGRSSPCYPLGPLSSKSPGTSRLGPQVRHGRIQLTVRSNFLDGLRHKVVDDAGAEGVCEPNCDHDQPRQWQELAQAVHHWSDTWKPSQGEKRSR